MQKRYFWLKFKTDFFSAPPIKKMRQISGGDTFVIIYLKLQLLSVPQGGFIDLTGIEDNYWDELALLIDEDPQNIQITCMYLIRYNLLQILDNQTLYLPDAAENIGSESDSAQRMRRLRDRQKQQSVLPASHSDATMSLQSALPASHSDTSLASQSDTSLASQSDKFSRAQSDAISSQSDGNPQINYNTTQILPKKSGIYAKASHSDDRERERERDRSRSRSQNQKQKNKKNNTDSDDCQDQDNDFFIFCLITAFEKLFEREPNKSFVTSIRNLAKDGLQIGDMQEAILTASRKQPRKPEPYILTICKHMLQQRQANQQSSADAPLEDWELQWLEDIKIRNPNLTIDIN